MRAHACVHACGWVYALMHVCVSATGMQAGETLANNVVHCVSAVRCCVLINKALEIHSTVRARNYVNYFHEAVPISKVHAQCALASESLCRSGEQTAYLLQGLVRCYSS